MVGEIEREGCQRVVGEINSRKLDRERNRERVVGEIEIDIGSERGSQSDSDRKDRER